MNTEQMGWERIDSELRGLAKRRAGLDAEEAEWLLLGEAAKVHRELGFASYVEYLGSVFGYSTREAHERLRVARRLEALPQVGEALRDGEMCWSAARELGRVATAETEEVWLEQTRGVSVREVEQMVSGLKKGDLPDDPKDPGAERHVLRFEVSGDTLATWREAVKRVRAELGTEATEDDVLLTMARMALGRPGSRDEGRASYQIAVSFCPTCDETAMETGGEAIGIEDAVFEMACCDAQHIGETHVGARPTRASQDIPPATRRRVVRRDRACCVVDGCKHTQHIDVHHLIHRADFGQHDDDNLIVLCSAHHRATHVGALRIVGKPSSGMRFFHADGTPYGSRRPELRPRAALRPTSGAERTPHPAP